MFSKDFENYKLALSQYSEQALINKQRSQAFFESNLVYQKLLTKMVIGLCNKTNILYIGRLENVRYQDLISPDRKLFDVYDYVSKRHVYFEGLIYEYSDCKLKSLTQLLAQKGIVLDATDQALDWIAEKGFQPEFGARPLKRVIQSEVLNRLSKEIISGNIKENSVILLDYFAEDDHLAFRTQP